MFSPFARDLLKPQMFERMDSLMKPILPVVEDPWIDDYYKFNTFTNKLHFLKNKPICKKSNTFQLYLNANQFQPEHISIEIVDGLIIIHGEHKIKPDVEGYVSRKFTRRCKIPEYIDPTTLSAVFNKNGLLIIKARQQTEDLTRNGEITIPIKIQKPVVENVTVKEEKPNFLEESDTEVQIKKET